MAQVAAYLRRSTPGEEDKNTTLDTQLKDITAWAEREGHVVVATFSDPGGRSDSLERPALRELIDQARLGNFDIVAVWRFDRFSRDQEQTIIAVFTLKQYGVKVVSVTQPLPDGPTGMMLLSTYQFGARLELDAIRERMNRGKKERVHSGKLTAMNCPKYGYLFADEKKERFVPDPNSAPIVQRIYAEYVSGKSMRKIAIGLIDDGIPPASKYQHLQGWRLTSPASDYWTVTGIRNILIDRTYIGRRVGMETMRIPVTLVHPMTGAVRIVMRRVKRSVDDANRYEYPPDVCPPLVSEETFAAAQVKLTENREMSSRRLTHAEVVLLRSPLAECGYCRGTLGTKYDHKSGSHFYRCSSRDRIGRGSQEGACTNPRAATIKSETLDAACWTWFVEQLTHPERLREQYEVNVAKSQVAQEVSTTERQAIGAALQQAKESEESYLAAVGSAKSDDMRQRFVQLAEESHEQCLSLSERLEELILTEAQRREQVNMIRSFQEAAPTAIRKLEGVSIQQRRAILYRFGVRATLWGKEHDPRYEFHWVFDS